MKLFLITESDVYQILGTSTVPSNYHHTFSYYEKLTLFAVCDCATLLISKIALSAD